MINCNCLLQRNSNCWLCSLISLSFLFFVSFCLFKWLCLPCWPMCSCIYFKFLFMLLFKDMSLTRFLLFLFVLCVYFFVFFFIVVCLFVCFCFVDQLDSFTTWNCSQAKLFCSNEFLNRLSRVTDSQYFP
jgi:hypothetical protein